jgi:hypothetical protein
MPPTSAPRANSRASLDVPPLYARFTPSSPQHAYLAMLAPVSYDPHRTTRIRYDTYPPTLLPRLKPASQRPPSPHASRPPGPAPSLHRPTTQVTWRRRQPACPTCPPAAPPARAPAALPPCAPLTGAAASFWPASHRTRTARRQLLRSYRTARTALGVDRGRCGRFVAAFARTKKTSEPHRSPAVH